MVKNLYETEYFSRIDIDFSDGILTFDLLENPAVGKIYLDGSELIKYDMIKNELQVKERGIYTRSKVKEDADRLQSIYQKFGYTSAIVEPKVVILKGNRVDIVFEITEGDPAFIRALNFHGNKVFSKKELSEVGKIYDKSKSNIFSKGSKYEQDSVESMKDYIIKNYHEHGYIDARIDNINVQFSKDASDVLLDIYLYEGEKYFINDIEIQADDKYEKIAKLARFSNKKGDPYKLSKIENDKHEIEKKLYDNGFGYVQVDIRKIKKDQAGLVDVVFKIRDDDVKMVRNIMIKGSKKTQDFVIRRELLLSEGSVFIPKDLVRSRNRIMSLGYFKNIDIKETKVSDKEVDVVVTIEEDNRRGMFNASAGYSSFEKQVLGLSLFLPNISGSGKDFSTDFSISRISKSINFGINTARFGDSKFGGGINFGIVDFNPKAYGINYRSKSYYIAPTLSYRLDDNLFYYLTYSFRKDNMENNTSSSLFLRTLFLDQFKNITTSSISNSIYYDTRDNFILPNMGSRIGGGQTIAGVGGNQRFLRHDIELTTYKQLIGKDSPFMISLKAGTVKGLGQDVLFQNRYNVSYFNMRGFGYGGIGPRFVETRPDGGKYIDKISYRGNNYAVFTLQQNFPIPFAKESGARWYVFSDFGMLYGFDGTAGFVNSLGNTEEIVDSKMIRNATGVGIAFPSPFGVLSLDYSAKIKHAAYDDVQKFRISIGGMPIA